MREHLLTWSWPDRSNHLEILYTAIAKHMPAESRLNDQRHEVHMQSCNIRNLPVVIECLHHFDCVSSCQEGVNYNNGTRVHGTYST